MVKPRHPFLGLFVGCPTAVPLVASCSVKARKHPSTVRQRVGSLRLWTWSSNPSSQTSQAFWRAAGKKSHSHYLIPLVCKWLLSRHGPGFSSVFNQRCSECLFQSKGSAISTTPALLEQTVTLCAPTPARVPTAAMGYLYSFGYQFGLSADCAQTIKITPPNYLALYFPEFKSN